MPASPQFAFVTLVTTDQYLPGALVVAASLRDIHSSPPDSPEELDPSEFHIVCLVTPESVNVTTVKLLRKAFDVVVGVELIEEETEEGLKLLGRLDLKTVLTKLHIFRLTSYKKVVFLDADVLPLRPLSHLFNLPSDFAAVPDVGWPDIFNSGFLVITPSTEKFDEVMSLVKSKGSWDGGDQGVLNEWKGNEWERLSFTYNTTPTAAYTYAPAYKRFGSQISNIHFIGPNKPWHQIPLRSPESSSSNSTLGSGLSQDFAPPPTYAYPALLDRWFAVYDKHYHSFHATPVVGTAVVSTPFTSADATHPEGESVNLRYDNVWDSGARPEVTPEASASGAPLGLQELRRLAIEGSGGSRATAGEGVYQSLPLNGRIDLMRPQKPGPSTPEKPVLLSEKLTLPVVQIEVLSSDPQTPIRSPAPMTTLPTPGPNEIPPAPMIRGHSLPPETPTHARHLETHPRPVSPLRATSPPHPTFEPPRDPPSPLHHARSVSPLHLSWNPAVEPPPSVQPPVSQFPEGRYFQNVWDARTQAPDTPEEDLGIFPLPPPSNIPEQLIKEGHYKAVIGEPGREDRQRPRFHAQQQDSPRISQHDVPQYHTPSSPSQPQPDRSKVVSVFPWEERPRHAPQRFFPPTDSPPPGQSFIQPSPALKLDLHPPRTSSITSPPPVHGFPRTTTYANAWDAVPSIQRYASRLVRPVPAPVPELAAGPGRTRKGSVAAAGGDRYRSWQDQAEASSRDADDEDDGEEEEEASPPSVAAESERGDGSGPPTHQVKGVQTTTPEMRHRGVQVPHGTQSSPKNLLLGLEKDAKKEELQGELAPPKVQAFEQMVDVSSTPTRQDETSPASTPQDKVHSTPALSLSPSGVSVGAGSPYSSPAPLSLPGASQSPAAASRPAGRTFDPARGVDVFKKGSEEVLARFLRMDSWDKEGQSPPSTA